MWQLGVALAALGSFLSNLGLNLQKLSHLRQEEEGRLGSAGSRSVSRNSIRYDRIAEEEGDGHTSPAAAPAPPASARDAPLPHDDDAAHEATHLIQHSHYPNSSSSNSRSTRTGSVELETLEESDELRFSGSRRFSEEALSLSSSDEEVVPEVHYTNRPLWRLGLLLIILGSLGDFSALAFASQSVVAPLGALTLVSNVFLAPTLLHEERTRIDIIATIGIVVGCGIAVGYAPHQEVDLTLKQLFDLYTTPRFVFYSICAGATMLWMFSSVKFFNRLRDAAFAAEAMLYDARNPGSKSRPSASTEQDMVALEEEAESARASYEAVRKIHRFLYPALSGIVGAQSVLFAKVVAEMLVATFEGEGILFLHWQAYLVLGGMLSCIILQIRFLNEALIRFDSLYCVPVFQSFWILVSVVNGMVFFDEYEEVFRGRASRAVMFPFGVFITVGGVYALTQQARGGPEPLEDDLEFAGDAPKDPRRHSLSPEHMSGDERSTGSHSPGPLRSRSRGNSSELDDQLHTSLIPSTPRKSPMRGPKSLDNPISAVLLTGSRPVHRARTLATLGTPGLHPHHRHHHSMATSQQSAGFSLGRPAMGPAAAATAPASVNGRDGRDPAVTSSKRVQDRE